MEPVDYGMPEFVSPEIAKGEGVDLSSDMWSVGVITHLLLTGVSLFRCVNDADTLNRVKDGSYTLSSKISDLAKDFISKLLVFNANDRLDVITALRHPWLQFGEDIPTDSSRINTDSLRNYYNNFKYDFQFLSVDQNNNIIIVFLEIGTVMPRVETGIGVVHYLQHTLTHQK